MAEVSASERTGWVTPWSTASISPPKSTVISTSAGEFGPSAFTRSIKPSLTKMALTLMPVDLVKASKSGWISPVSRVV